MKMCNKDNDTVWENNYRDLINVAGKCLNPEYINGQVIVVKAITGKIYSTNIPDYRDKDNRELIENKLIEILLNEENGRVQCCLCIMSDLNPIIPSWNFLKRLIDINSDNMHTETFLSGGADCILVKDLEMLIPPPINN